MSNINKAILKVAQSNPEFARLLQAELSKEAAKDPVAKSKVQFKKHLNDATSKFKKMDGPIRSEDWAGVKRLMEGAQRNLKDAESLLMGLVP